MRRGETSADPQKDLEVTVAETQLEESPNPILFQLLSPGSLPKSPEMEPLSAELGMKLSALQNGLQMLSNYGYSNAVVTSTGLWQLKPGTRKAGKRLIVQATGWSTLWVVNAFDVLMLKWLR